MCPGNVALVESGGKRQSGIRTGLRSRLDYDIRGMTTTTTRLQYVCLYDRGALVYAPDRPETRSIGGSGVANREDIASSPGGPATSRVGGVASGTSGEGHHASSPAPECPEMNPKTAVIPESSGCLPATPSQGRPVPTRGEKTMGINVRVLRLSTTEDFQPTGCCSSGRPDRVEKDSRGPSSEAPPPSPS